jgi:hypothetical protein
MPFMPVDVDRLLRSDFWHVSNGDEFKTGFRLICESWSQTPAGSLPTDDRLLAGLSGMTLSRWCRVKPRVLHGWIKCTDDRFYHPVVAEKALTAWIARLAAEKRSAVGNAKQGKKSASPEAIEKRIDVAEAYLLKLREGHHTGCTSGLIEETKDRVEEEVKDEREAIGNVPPPVTDASSLLWEQRVREIHDKFAGVLNLQNSDVVDPDELIAYVDDGYEWDTEIKPGLYFYLGHMHPTRMQSPGIRTVQSFGHPGIREQIEKRAAKRRKQQQG